MKKPFRQIELVENNYYVVWIYYTHKEIYVLKKTSAQGYNFINTVTGKKFFKSHMYMDKKQKKFNVICSINISENLDEANTNKSKLFLRCLKIKNLIKIL